MNAAVDHYLSLRQALALPGQGTPWLDALREEGRKRFNEAGFPTLRDEDWRYTNLRSMLRNEFVPADRTRLEPVSADGSYGLAGGMGSYQLVFVDGRYHQTLSDADGLHEDVVVDSLSRVLSSGSTGIEKMLGSCVPQTVNGFTALNTAFIEDGVYLHVGDHCRVDRPVEIIFLSTECSGQLTQPRNVYVVGKGSGVKIVERYVCVGESDYFTNAVSEVVARESSVVEHTRIQEESARAFHVGGLFMQLHQDAAVVSNNVALGSLIARTDILASLKASGANCDLNGVYVVNGRQHVDNFTQVDHEQPDCRSDEFYKGVLDNRARAVFRGRVVVHEDAQRTDAQQQNRNLLLSEHSEINTKPQLEIYADDVKCSHGATVGQLDEDALFYLRSRGIDEVTARSFLTYAFTADVLNRFSLEPVRDHVEATLSRKLFGLSRLEEMA